MSERVNASVLDRNICHAFGAYGDAEVIIDAYWRFRNSHEPRCAERLAELGLVSFRLCAVAVARCWTDLPAADAWRVRIELDDFFRERLHHMETACLCLANRPVTPQPGASEEPGKRGKDRR